MPLLLLALACGPLPALDDEATAKAGLPELAWGHVGRPYDALGAALVAGADVNGDGAPDIAVTAPGRAATTEPGAAQVWFGGSPDLGSAPDAGVGNPGTDPNGGDFGAHVALGDADGDGLADLFVVERRWDGTVDRIAGYPSTGAGVTRLPWWSLPSPTGDDAYGDTLAVLDFDGDGDQDVLVGAADTRVGSDHRGALWLWPGSPDGPRVGHRLDADADLAGDTQFGDVLAAVGDTNGDGLDDLVVSATGARSSASAGRVHWYAGSAALALPARAPWTVSGESGSLGRQLAGMGDLDGDGYDDFAVLDAREDDVYAIRLYRGGSLGPSEEPAWTVVTDAAERVGHVLAACDVDGDGVKDLALQAGDTDEVHVYTHVVDEPTARTWTLARPDGGAFGTTLACAGDLDGDGREELLVGDYTYRPGVLPSGAVWLYRFG